MYDLQLVPTRNSDSGAFTIQEQDQNSWESTRYKRCHVKIFLDPILDSLKENRNYAKRAHI